LCRRNEAGPPILATGFLDKAACVKFPVAVWYLVAGGCVIGAGKIGPAAREGRERA